MAIRFDNDADILVRTANLPSYDANYTFCAWLYIVAHPGNGNYKTVFSLNRNSGTDSWDDMSLYGAGATDTRLLVDAFVQSGAYNEQAGSTALSTGTWYHVALVRSANNSRIAYLNGVADATLTASYSSRTAPSRMDVCNFTSGGGGSPSARIAGIKIWTRALTAAEIAAEAQALRPLDPTSLHICSPCWPGAAERVLDYSGNGYAWTAGGTLTDEDPPPVPWGAAPLALPYLAAGGENVTVAPAAATAKAAATAPTTVLGALTIAPAARTAAAASVAPAVALGSLSVSPAARSAAASTVSPTVVLGSVSVTPAAREAGADSVAPTVLLGSTSAAPAASQAIASSAAPTVVLGSLAISPAAAVAATSTAAPAVTLGSIAVTPGASAAATASVAPAVILGSISIAPDPATAAAAGADPTVEAGGGTTVSPAAASAPAGVTAPAVILGSTSVTPGAAAAATSTAAPTVVGGSLTITPAACTAAVSVSAPSVALGSITYAPNAIATSASTTAPAIVLGDTTLVPVEASAVAGVAGPTVWVGDPTAYRNLRAKARDTALSPAARSTRFAARARSASMEVPDE